MHRKRTDEDAAPLLTAAQCARRTGVTVKALRVYEREGLLRPFRTEKDWRLYGPDQVRRIGAIVALKLLGLGLTEIRIILDAGGDRLEPMLEMQVVAWRRRVAEAERGLRHAEGALASLRNASSPTLDDLCETVRRLTMDEMPKVFDELIPKHFSAKEVEALKARKFTMEDQQKVAAAWDEVIGTVKRLIADGVPPDHPDAKAVAARWRELVAMFDRGDQAVRAKSGAMWTEALNRDPQGQELPFGKDVWDYVGKAMRS